MPSLRDLAALALWALLPTSVLAGAPAPVFDPLPASDGDAPPVELAASTLDGGTWRLSEHRGEVVLVTFWAGWCPPCVAEMPALGRLAERLQGRRFVLVAIDTGEPEARARVLVQQLGIRFRVLTDPDGTLFSGWGGRILPSAFLVDGQARRRLIAQGPVDWDDPEVIGTVEGLIGEDP